MSERCSAFKQGGGYHRSRCTRTASVEEDGKWWCRQHAPSAVAERDRKREEKFEADWAAQKQRWAEAEKRRAREDACVNAFHSPTRTIATEQITEGLFWRMYDLLETVRRTDEGALAEYRALGLGEPPPETKALTAQIADLLSCLKIDQ